jgi:hypothetical protein
MDKTKKSPEEGHPDVLSLLESRLQEFLDRIRAGIANGEVSEIDHRQRARSAGDDAPTLRHAQVVMVYQTKGPALYLSFGEIEPEKSPAD